MNVLNGVWLLLFCFWDKVKSYYNRLTSYYAGFSEKCLTVALVKPLSAINRHGEDNCPAPSCPALSSSHCKRHRHQLWPLTWGPWPRSQVISPYLFTASHSRRVESRHQSVPASLFIYSKYINKHFLFFFSTSHITSSSTTTQAPVGSRLTFHLFQINKHFLFFFSTSHITSSSTTTQKQKSLHPILHSPNNVYFQHPATRYISSVQQSSSLTLIVLLFPLYKWSDEPKTRLAASCVSISDLFAFHG